MPLPLAIALLALSNLMGWSGTLIFNGQLMPQTLAPFYANTTLAFTSRALAVGLIATLATPAAVLAFKHQATASVLLQAAFSVGYMVFMSSYIGNKEITPQVAAAIIVAILALCVLGCTFHNAPVRLAH